MFHILLRASGDEYQVQSYKQGQHAEMILQEGNVSSLISGLLNVLIFFTAKDVTVSTRHPLDINYAHKWV